MPDYVGNAATATAKITEFGKEVTLQAPATTNGGWDAAEVLPDPVAAMFLETGYRITHRTETAVQAGDIVGLLTAEAGAVEAGWTITVNGKNFEVVDAQPLQPGDVRILTEIIARR